MTSRGSDASAIWSGPFERRAFLRGALGLGGALALGGCASGISAQGGWPTRPRTGGRISVRWLGGGIVELATPDYKQIAYSDAWIWDNAGWDRFGVKKPPEYASPEGFAA